MSVSIKVFFRTKTPPNAWLIFKNPSVVDMAKKEHRQRVGKNFEYTPLLGNRTPPLDYRKIN